MKTLMQRRQALDLPLTIFALAICILAAAVIVYGGIQAGLVLAAGALLILVVVVDASLLIQAATVALIIGSSQLAIRSTPLAFASKFALMALIGGVGVAALLLTSRPHRIPRGLTLGFLGIVVVSFVSVTYSYAPAISFSRAGALGVLWLATMVAIPTLMDGPNAYLTQLWRIGVTAGLVVVTGLVGAQLGWVEGWQLGRFHGILENPNTLGYFLAPILPGLFILATQTHGRHQRRLWLVVSILAAGLVLSGSRAGMISVVAGVVLGFVAAPRSRRAAVMILLAGAVATSLLLAFDRPLRPPESGQLVDETGSGRLIVWRDSLRLINQRPFLGWGFATTPELFPDLQDRSAQARAGISLGRIHNSYLEGALDLGWTGMAVLLILAGSGVIAAWRLSRSGPRYRLVGSVLVAGIAGGMVEGVFETGLLAAGGLLAFHFWLLVGAAHSLRVQQRRHATVADQ